VNLDAAVFLLLLLNEPIIAALVIVDQSPGIPPHRYALGKVCANRDLSAL
jgi:hypothetical protein